MTTINSTNSARKAPVTHKDLTMAYLMAGGGQKGVDAISPLLANHTDAVGVLEKVIGSLTANKQPASELIDLRDEFAAALTPGVKGRKPVTVGQSRSYSVQQIGDDGDVFIRLPLSTLGVRKHDKIMATFTADGVQIKRLHKVAKKNAAPVAVEAEYLTSDEQAADVDNDDDQDSQESGEGEAAGEAV